MNSNGIGSYYTPYFPTPGQPRIAPGTGSYPMGEYYQPGMGEYYQPGMGAYYSPQTSALGTGPTLPEFNWTMFLIDRALDGLGGYAVGKAIGHPVAGAIGGAIGLTGLFIATMISVRK